LEPNVWFTFRRLTRCTVQKDWRGAEENIKEALQITDRYFNDISPRAARIFINLARVYRDQVRNLIDLGGCYAFVWLINSRGFRQKRYDEAISAYKKAQDIRQELFPDTRDVGFCIGTTPKQLGPSIETNGFVVVVQTRANWKMPSPSRKGR